MKVFKTILNFYIDCSFHVALSATVLTYITYLKFDISADYKLLSFVFLGTLSGYNFVKYYGIAKFHHRSLSQELQLIQWVSVVCALLLLYFVFTLKIQVLLIVLGLGLITFFYAIPFLPKHFFIDKMQNLRSISGLKVYLIALIWTGVTVFLPVINAEIEISIHVINTGIQCYLFVLAWMLPFEIRDLKYDSLKLSTIPQQIGIKSTKILGVVLLFLFCVLQYFDTHTSTIKFSVILLISLITLLFVVCATKEQGKYYSAFWVEALPMYWLLLIIMVNVVDVL